MDSCRNSREIVNAKLSDLLLAGHDKCTLHVIPNEIWTYAVATLGGGDIGEIA